MSVELIWKHQQETYEKMIEQLSKTKKAGYIYPTSCGKSFPVLKYLEQNQDKRVLFLAPSIEIIEQFKEYVQRYIMSSRIIPVKRQFKDWHFITYNSLRKFNAKEEKVDIIISDELHRTGGEVWGKEFDYLLENNPDADKIGITATPKRTDGRNMMDQYFADDIIYEFSKIEALSGDKTGEVVLKPTRYIRVMSIIQPVLKEYRERIEQIPDEKKKEKLLSKFEKLKKTLEIADKIEDTYEKAMQNKTGKYIVFCRDESDMQEAMEKAKGWFAKVNPNMWIDYVYSGHQDSKMRKSLKLNRQTMNEFKRPSSENKDKLKLLFCVNKLNEGVHVDGISGIIMLRPTGSPVLYDQQIGRGFITADKESEETVIIDAANNWIRFYDTYKEVEKSIRKGKTRREQKEAEKDEELYKSFDFIAEEIELIELLKEIDGSIKGTKFLENAKGVKEWIDNSGDTKLPSETSEDMEEAYWGLKLHSIRSKFIKPYMDLETEEAKEEYRRKSPQIEEVIKIIEQIDRNVVPINLRNARKIKEWIDKSGDTKKPSSVSKDEEERKLCNSIKGIRRFIRKYTELQTEEEKEAFKKAHPELEEVMKIMEEIEKNDISETLKNARAIKEWIENSGDTKIPSRYSGGEEGKYLGQRYWHIKDKLIRPYLELETEQEKEDYKRRHPNLEEIMQIIEEIDRNNIPTFLRNARAIKEWIQKSEDTKPPVSSSKDETESFLGGRLSAIRNELIKPYLELKTEQEQDKYKQKHPELEEVMQIVEEIDRNNVPIFLKNARGMKEWFDRLENKRMPQYRANDEEEAKWGMKLRNIRTRLVNRYIKLEKEEEKEKFKQQYPEFDEVMGIVYEMYEECDKSENIADRRTTKFYKETKALIKQYVFSNQEVREELAEKTRQYNERIRGVEKND